MSRVIHVSSTRAHGHGVRARRLWKQLCKYPFQQHVQGPFLLYRPASLPTIPRMPAPSHAPTDPITSTTHPRHPGDRVAGATRERHRRDPISLHSAAHWPTLKRHTLRQAAQRSGALLQPGSRTLARMERPAYLLENRRGEVGCVLHMHFARLCRASACVARSKPSGWSRVPTSHCAVGHVTMCGNKQTPGCLSGSWVSEEGGCRVPCSESPKRGNVSLRESADSFFRGLVRRCLLSHPSPGDAATSNGRKRSMATPLLAETCAHYG